MIYAPVIIPTLNRKVHLKRCLDSLAANTGADQTEVFVSVDYPPSERYCAGYYELREYLEHGNFSMFKAMHIHYQDKNLGVSGNAKYLNDLVIQRFDRWIFTEDDNEFSPNFLEYINKGLERFESDDRVIGICAAKDTNWMCGDKEITFAKLFPAYGYGTWLKKEQKLVQECSRVLVPEKPYGPVRMCRLMGQNLCLFYHYICGILCRKDGLFWNPDGTLNLCDSVRSLYMHMTDHVCVVPAVAKSRTWGNDGSGVNMPASSVDPEREFPIDTKAHFEYGDVSGLRFYEENYKLGDRYMSGQYRGKWFVPLGYYILLLVCLGKRDRACSVINKIRCFLRKRKDR